MLIVCDLVVPFEDWVGRYDLEAATGTLTAIVGPSGGGKSTLLNTIAGFERVASGSLSFAGKDLLPLAPAARPVAIIFQDHNLLPNLTSSENAGLALSPSLRLSASDREAVAAMLARLGLSGFDARHPAELSGGQRQRVALARALLTTRPLLLLDEPLTGLDPTLRRETMTLIDALRREKGLTVLMTTHTPEDVEDRADQILRVEEGRVSVITRAPLAPPGDPPQGRAV